ncbi:hypothetical protein LPTSP4_15970 [Leptospira ryugenii]|uniref:Lipoprotein n=1 Tax=Leptospira ryugenii TaxID=1917863 RepID=A0A2P2DZL5_9LEPT|nr:hypothetical protein [Leptospira ryugenii]GBF50074.1 hypothetical protein LPTSP4_15970 [Leptospira ryugenii]
MLSRFLAILFLSSNLFFCQPPTLDNSGDGNTRTFLFTQILRTLLRPAPQSIRACDDLTPWTANYPSVRSSIVTIPDAVTDVSGNLYLLTMGTLLPENLKNDQGGNQIFLIKYNREGNVAWSLSLGKANTSNEYVGELLLEKNSLLISTSVISAIPEATGASFIGSLENIGVFEVSTDGTIKRGRYFGNSGAAIRTRSFKRISASTLLILAQGSGPSNAPINAGSAKITATGTNSTAFIISIQNDFSPNYFTFFSAGGFTVNSQQLLVSTDRFWLFGDINSSADPAFANGDNTFPTSPGTRHYFIAGYDANGNYLRHRYLGISVSGSPDSPFPSSSVTNGIGIVGTIHTANYITTPTPSPAYQGPNREQTSFAFNITDGSIKYSAFHGVSSDGYFNAIFSDNLGATIAGMTKGSDPGVGISYPGGRVELLSTISESNGSRTKFAMLPLGNTSNNFRTLPNCDGSLVTVEIDYDDLANPNTFKTIIRQRRRSDYSVGRTYIKPDGSLEYKEN